jgi:UDP-N-acetylglucosamine 1-carboxyvinyltransferase
MANLSTATPRTEERIVLIGGQPLHGEVTVSGSKNSSLPILAAALLASKGQSVLHNVPDISDVDTMLAMLASLGAQISREGTTVIIDAQNLSSHAAPDALVRKMRASFYVAAPLLARMRQAEVPLPGGCVLGDRPVNYHIDAFRAMGAEIKVEHGAMNASAPVWKGAKIFLEPKNSSVGATVNIMMAASLADGHTVIENAAREPEIVNLAEYLRKAGAQIWGDGSSTIHITGVSELRGVEHEIFNDRIEAGTYLAAAGITGGDVKVIGLCPEHLPVFLDRMAEAGVEIECGDRWIRARSNGILRATDVTTAPFPGFATDLQPLFVTMMCRAVGRSVVEESIYTGRFNYVSELTRMGAAIERHDNLAVVNGVGKLSGAIVEATDLRAGAALVIAGLWAAGKTEVTEVQYIDRGYVDFVEKLAGLGAQVARQNVLLPEVGVSTKSLEKSVANSSASIALSA